MKNIPNKSKGYTIIETMISVAIFLVIVEFGMGSLLGASSLHKKSQDMRSILDSLSFIIDDISRNVRTGFKYQCFRKNTDATLSPATLGNPRSCVDGWAIAFESDAGNTSTLTDQVVYYIASGKIWKSTDGAQNFTTLTADEISIDTVSGFSVLGAESPSGSTNRQQPLIVIRFAGSITYKNVVTPFYIETSASQRLIDI